MTDGDDMIPDPRQPRLTQIDDRQDLSDSIQLQQGQIQRLRIGQDLGANHTGKIALRLSRHPGRLEKDRQTGIGFPGLLFDHYMGIREDQPIRLNDRTGSTAPLPSAIRIAHHHDDAGSHLLVNLARREVLANGSSAPHQGEREQDSPRQRPHHGLLLLSGCRCSSTSNVCS